MSEIRRGTYELYHEIVGHVEDEVDRLGVGSLDIAMNIKQLRDCTPRGINQKITIRLGRAEILYGHPISFDLPTARGSVLTSSGFEYFPPLGLD